MYISRSSRFICLLCGLAVDGSKVYQHKLSTHPKFAHYGFMWPTEKESAAGADWLAKIPTYESESIAQILGVRHVYIRDEGQNRSGSMKDYSVTQALRLGMVRNDEFFFIVSSGNHACALATYTKFIGKKALAFTPASSSKIPYLSTFSNVLTIGIEGAIFEDVYNFVACLGLSEISGFYDANVRNESLLPGFMTVSSDILNLSPKPTHVLAGVGNGSYLAGIALGFEQQLVTTPPKIVAVGMSGAFPSEIAFQNNESIYEYKFFLTSEEKIDAAEGSIATESYSMPQLMHSLKITNGFTLGDLQNKDLAIAYQLLAQDKSLLAKGIVPEPTGIMALAAAYKWRERFSSTDILHLSFTGHGAKDLKGIERLVPNQPKLVATAKASRPDLVVKDTNSMFSERVLVVKKDINTQELLALVQDKLRGG